MGIKIYGLSNCDTTRLAMKWLKAQDLNFEFVDLRQQQVSVQIIERWMSLSAVDKILNKKSKTWRELPSSVKDLNDLKDMVGLLETYPTLIKRPLLERNGTILTGFNEKEYKSFFNLS